MAVEGGAVRWSRSVRFSARRVFEAHRWGGAAGRGIHRRLVLLLLAGAVGCDGGDTSSSPSSQEADPNPQDALYVCNRGSATVSVIDPASNEVVRTVDLAEKDFSKNAEPYHVAVEPDGSAWYVSLVKSNAVVKFNARNEVEGIVRFDTPGLLALHPTMDRLYAGHAMRPSDVPNTLAVLRRSDMERVAVLDVVIDRPHGLAVSPTGEFVYSSSLATNRIVAVKPSTNRIIPPAVLAGPRQGYLQMDVSGTGETAYVTGKISGQVQVLDLQNPAQPSLEDSVAVGGAPWHPQLSADDSILYVGSKATDTVSAVDTETLSTATIEGDGFAQPHGTALSPDGRFLYVSNNNTDSASEESVGTVVAIDTETNDVQTAIEVGTNPTGLATRWQR